MSVGAGAAAGVGAAVGADMASVVGVAACGAGAKVAGADRPSGIVLTVVAGGSDCGALVGGAVVARRGVRRRKYQAPTVARMIPPRAAANSGMREPEAPVWAARSGTRLGGLLEGRNCGCQLSLRGPPIDPPPRPEPEGFSSASSAARSSRVGRDVGVGIGMSGMERDLLGGSVSDGEGFVRGGGGMRGGGR